MEGKWKEWHSWSRTRESLLETCPRAYYYQYIGSYDQRYNDILPTTKRMIKNMHNIKYLLGDLIHEAIKNQFDQISRGRPFVNSKAVLNYVSRRITEIKKNKEKNIVEAMNGKAISDTDLIEIGEEAKRQLNIFFNEFIDSYKDLQIITHEEYCKIDINGHTFWVVPDLITKSDDGRIYITDWKTDSTYSDAIDEYQMKMYILWALEEGISDLDHLRAEVVFLDIGKSEEFKTTKEEIESFKKELIFKSTELYEKIDSKSGKDDFNKCDNEEICNSCGFKSSCSIDS